MEAIWTASAEAILAEQSWQRSERERHQRLLYQLKLELQQERRQQHKAGVAPTVLAPVVPAPVASTALAPTDVVPPLPSGLTPEPAESVRQERVFRSPKKSLPPVQIL